VAAILPEPPPPPEEGGWRRIERRATPRDLLLKQTWQAKQTEAMIECRARASELELHGVKIIAAEYNYDGTRLAFLFSTETEDKVELKSLKRDMQKKFPGPQIELRQIGPRDVAKMIGGMGACGLETRCCSKFLTDFSPISIKMAKEQGISLTPTEITGMCGRLRCCLVYEFEQYVAARKELPKRNKRVVTPRGEGKVVDVLPMSSQILVMLDNDERHYPVTFERDEVQPWDELEALRRKTESPCDRHEGGGCTCGKQRQETEVKAEHEQKPERETKPERERKPEKEQPRQPSREQKQNRPPKHEQGQRPSRREHPKHRDNNKPKGTK
jgi:cell fate regulator YaaT (PSP1 superfamily)